MDTPTVKNILGITTTKHDTYLNIVIPLFTATVKDYCNNDFLVENVETLPGSVKVAIAKWVELNMNVAGLQNRSMGGVSYSYNTDVPESIKTLLKPFRKVRF